MITTAKESDFEQIYQVINDAAGAYKGIIPADRWHDPYMSKRELLAQMKDGVKFWCYVDGSRILGVMGIQDKTDVSLIRHAYVRTISRNMGVGGKLLAHLSALTSNPILIGTWASASWAIRFYLKHGFQLVCEKEKDQLLRKYWSIPERQIEASVVLCSPIWKPLQ